MQQSINLHLWTPRHPNPSTETAWHTHRTTRIDVLRRQTTHGHTRTNTRKPTGHGWSGGWSGQNRNYWKILHVYVFFQKKWLIPFDRSLITLDTLYVQTHEPQKWFPHLRWLFRTFGDVLVLRSTLEIVLANILRDVLVLLDVADVHQCSKVDFPYCCFVCPFMTSFHSLSTAAFASGINIAWEWKIFCTFSRFAEACVSERETSRIFWTIRSSRFLEVRWTEQHPEFVLLASQVHTWEYHVLSGF